MQATVKFNRLLASNHRLRDEIDHLLKERTFFNQVYQDLTDRLNSGKKIMMDLIEQSTLAYDQRYSDSKLNFKITYLISRWPRIYIFVKKKSKF